LALPTPLQMMGAPGSPCSRKMRSLLHNRRIPNLLILHNSREAANLSNAGATVDDLLEGTGCEALFR